MVDRDKSQEQVTEQLIFNSQLVIMAAAEAIAGTKLEDLDTANEYLAKSPGIGPRSETDFPRLESLSVGQEQVIRDEAAKIGIGAEASTGLKEAGMQEGTTVILEGGLPNKMLAQLKMVSENETKPGLVILSASNTRIASDSDKKRMQQVTATLGQNTPDIEGKTEFELASITAGLLTEFESQEPTVLSLGYEIYDGGITPTEESTGQVTRIGTINNSPVVVVGVSELHRDDSGKNFYRPGVAHLTDLASKIAESINPGTENLPVATVTSHLYGPSRRLQNPNTLVYGTRVMEEVVGEEAALPTIQNIVSELHRTGELLINQTQ